MGQEVGDSSEMMENQMLVLLVREGGRVHEPGTSLDVSK